MLAYTVRLAIIYGAELERNGGLSLSLPRNVVLWLKRTSTKSLQIELDTKYNTNDAKRKVWYGSKSAKEGVISVSGFGRGEGGGGGLNPLAVQIRCETGSERNGWPELKKRECKKRLESIFVFLFLPIYLECSLDNSLRFLKGLNFMYSRRSEAKVLSVSQPQIRWRIKTSPAVSTVHVHIFNTICSFNSEKKLKR